MQIVVKSKLSAVNQPYILDAIEQGINDLSPPIRNYLADNEIMIGKRLSDIEPKAPSLLARGWGGRTLDYTTGYYSSRKIAMAQERRINDAGDYERTEKNLYKVFFHEAGHAFDGPNVKGSPSASRAMVDAYERDIQNLLKKPKAEQAELIDQYSYFLSGKKFRYGAQDSESAARDEVFAEAFGNILGGMGHTSSERQYGHGHKSLFANCYRIVEKAILSVDPDARLYPAHRRYYPSCPRSHFENAVELAVKTNTALRASFDSAAAAVSSTAIAANRTMAKIDVAVDNAAMLGMKKLKIYGPATAAALLLGCSVAPELEAKFLPDTNACKSYKREMMGGARMMKGVFTLPLMVVAGIAGSEKAQHHAFAIAVDFDRNKKLLQSCKL